MPASRWKTVLLGCGFRPLRIRNTMQGMVQKPSGPPIRSSQNVRFKTWAKYVRNPENESHPWLAVEGLKQISDMAAVQPVELLLTSRPQDLPAGLLQKSGEVVEIRADLLSRLSSVRTNQGVIAFFEKPVWKWDSIKPFILYLNGIQDPANLGTLVRTAWATRQFSILAAPGTVSFFNAKVIRASAAMLFHVPFLPGVSLEEIRRRGYRIVAAVPSGGSSLFEMPLRPPLAFVLGSEGGGIDQGTLREADGRVHIPMQTGCDSLNAGIAGALLLYEVYRRSRLEKPAGTL